MGNNTQSDFLCVDEVTTNEFRPSAVYMKAFFQDSVFYEGIVNEGNVFSIPLNEEISYMDVEIRDLTQNFEPGRLLQTMMMAVQCIEENSLTLLDTFGALQLVGYRNEVDGLRSVYTDLTIKYSATNVGSRDLILSSAYKTTAITGTQSLLPSTDGIVSIPGDSEIFSELLTVNLAAIVGGEGLNFSLLVKGEDSITGEECEDSDFYTLIL